MEAVGELFFVRKCNYYKIPFEQTAPTVCYNNEIRDKSWFETNWSTFLSTHVISMLC